MGYVVRTFAATSFQSIEGEYTLQPGKFNGKSYFQRTGAPSAQPMYLFWSVVYPEWAFHSDLLDTSTSVAWLPTDLIANEQGYDFWNTAVPQTRSYINEWYFGSAAGGNSNADDPIANVTLLALLSPSPSPPAHPSPPPFTCDAPSLEIVRAGGAEFCMFCLQCSAHCPGCD